MKNYQECLTFIQSDYYRYHGYIPSSVFNIYLYSIKNHCFRYQLWLRLSSVKGFLYPICKVMHLILTRKYGIEIARDTQIGYGLYIGHGFGLVVNSTAIIGNNCNLSQGVTIGSNHNHAAIIGDNVYVGPSVCIVENVKIGDNVTIGAGAVVTKDILCGMTVAGVPATVISSKEPARYIKNQWK